MILNKFDFCCLYRFTKSSIDRFRAIISIIIKLRSIRFVSILSFFFFTFFRNFRFSTRGCGCGVDFLYYNWPLSECNCVHYGTLPFIKPLLHQSCHRYVIFRGRKTDFWKTGLNNEPSIRRKKWLPGYWIRNDVDLYFRP